MRGWIALFACAGLTACAQSPYGNFAENSTPAINQQLATATVRQLATLHPPASTRLQIAQQTSDGYGIALVRTLRASGYSVQEFNPQAKAAEPSARATSPLVVNYIIDAPKDSNLYRVTLLVGRESLSRAYAVQNDRLQAAGVWVRKE
ncbi:MULTISPECIES: conjugal transfer protein TrbH [Pseudomonas]|uniref:conjugal transfer protein TrbH n=1 Tax=Pseudomonas TaxID=286 RepID=UPI0023D8766E|nr:conjugal transfer protein TrbH [Pseudomonas sp. PSE14]WEJ71963.1 conjugal transfer protein TrbH [Pseudomonas sp. PSE14]